MFFYFLLVQQLVAESICWRQFFISWLLVLCEERSPNLSSTQTSQHHIKMNLLFYFVIYIISWCYNFVYITSWCILYTVYNFWLSQKSKNYYGRIKIIEFCVINPLLVSLDFTISWLQNTNHTLLIDMWLR